MSGVSGRASIPGQDPHPTPTHERDTPHAMPTLLLSPRQSEDAPRFWRASIVHGYQLRHTP